MLNVGRIIAARGFLLRKYITGAEETRNMHKVLFEESSFGRKPDSMRSEGGDIIKTHRSALNLEMFRSSLKWFGGILFSAEKRNFLDWGDALYQTVNCNKLIIITTYVHYCKILITMYIWIKFPSVLACNFSYCSL